jgi:hypothetical protein
MTFIKYTSALALFMASTLALAADEQAALDKPSFSATQTEIITAKVEAINHETREVTLRGPAGNAVTFTASEEARNLDQVSVGDTVVAEYIERMSVTVVANDGMEPGAMGMTTIERAEKGDMPGVVAVDTEVITATVEEVNLEANTFKLKGPGGVIEEYAAMNPENLKRAAVGDLVIITMTEAMAISVEAGPAE